MPVDIRFATASDASALEPWLRGRDFDELVAVGGPDVERQLVGLVERSHGRLGQQGFAAVENGRVLALFGFLPVTALSETAVAWMVARDEVERHVGMLHRTAKAYCAVTLREYPLLFNYVDARNTPSIRWLKRIGFTLGPAEAFGASGLPFHRFEMRGADVR